MLTELLLIYPLNDYKNPLDISTANNSPLRLRLDITDFGTVCIVLGLTLAEQIFSWQKITPGNINKSFIGENWTRKQQSYTYTYNLPYTMPDSCTKGSRRSRSSNFGKALFSYYTLLHIQIKCDIEYLIKNCYV